MNEILPRSSLFIEGAKLTLLLTLYSGFFGILIGTATGVLKSRENALGRLLASVYTWLFRGTPLLVQIFFIYYALPAIHPLFKFSEFTAAVIALSLNVGAYNAEAIRAGILGIPKGQAEAAHSLGLSQLQSLRWVILPQAFRISIPPLINNLVALLKDSSLTSSIGLLELTLVGNRISSETFNPVPVLTTVACIYLIITSILTFIAVILEKRIARER